MATPPGKKFIPTKKDDKLSQHLIKFVDKGVEITPEVAQRAIIAFLYDEIGPFVEHEVNAEKALMFEKIKEEIDKLKGHINFKLEKISEEIIRELKANNIKEEVITRVINKINNIK